MSDASELYDAILKATPRRRRKSPRRPWPRRSIPSELVQKYMIPAMDEVGKRFECNDYFVPELLIAARAMKTSLALITPLLAESGRRAGRPRRDRHRAGRPARHRQEPRGLDARRRRLPGGRPGRERVAAEVRRGRPGEGRHDRRPRALLTTTMTMMKTVIEALEKAGIRSKTRVMIGGAPITQQYADEIGADGYTDNASAAVALARKLLRAKTWSA